MLEEITRRVSKRGGCRDTHPCQMFCSLRKILGFECKTANKITIHHQQFPRALPLVTPSCTLEFLWGGKSIKVTCLTHILYV